MSFSSKFGEKFGARLGEGMGNGIIRLTSVLFEATIYIISTFGKWLLDWQKGNEKESWLQANTLRIALTSFLVACFAMPGFITFSKNPPEEVVEDDSEGGQTLVFVQLKSDMRIIFPDKEWFKMTTDPRVQFYSNHQGIKYLHYKKPPWPWLKPYVVMREFSCAIVPAGKKITISSDFPPRSVVNMKDQVRYILDPKKVPVENQSFQLRWFGINTPQKTTWKKMIERWDMVNATKYTTTAYAIDKADLPPSQKGGLVCY